MGCYNIENGADSFIAIAMAIAFYESMLSIRLVIQKSNTDSYWQYRGKQHEWCPFWVLFGRRRMTSLLEMKKCHFIRSGAEVAAREKGGWKWKRQRKGLFKQSYVLASSIHRSAPKPALWITVNNYEGEELDYNAECRKVEEVTKLI